MDELRDRVAVVTGAASGIGLGLCRRFAQEGMRIAMVDVHPERLKAAADEVRALVSSSGEVRALTADVSNWEQMQSLEQKVVSELGVVNLLCNNAGVVTSGTTWEIPLEEWQWVLGIDLWGVIHGVKAFVPGMIEHGEPAHIINTTSIGGLLPIGPVPPYTAAKYAVTGLTQRLFLDLKEKGHNVGVSLLVPCHVVSDLFDNSSELSPSGPLRTASPSSTPRSNRNSADEVGGLVVEAIHKNRFWILTDSRYEQLVERQVRGVLVTDEVVDTRATEAGWNGPGKAPAWSSAY